jgi:hypothetical protein
MAWKLQRKRKPAPPAPEPATGNPPSADDLAPGEGRHVEAPAGALAPSESEPGRPAAKADGYTLHDSTVVEDCAAMGRTFTIPATPARRGIGDPCWWSRRR